MRILVNYKRSDRASAAAKASKRDNWDGLSVTHNWHGVRGACEKHCVADFCSQSKACA